MQHRLGGLGVDEHAIRVMVFNRLCDPDSKLGVLRWLETVSIPQVDILERFQAKLTDHEQETIDETRWQQLRLVIAHHPLRAKEQTAWRQAQINDLEDKAARWAGKLDSQDGGAKHRGRKLSDSGAKATQVRRFGSRLGDGSAR